MHNTDSLGEFIRTLTKLPIERVTAIIIHDFLRITVIPWMLKRMEINVSEISSLTLTQTTKENNNKIIYRWYRLNTSALPPKPTPCDLIIPRLTLVQDLTQTYWCPGIIKMNHQSKSQRHSHLFQLSDIEIHMTPIQQLLYQQLFLIALIYVVKGDTWKNTKWNCT